MRESVSVMLQCCAWHSTPRDEHWYRPACSYTRDLRLENLNVGLLPVERFTLRAAYAYAPSLHFRSASLHAKFAAGGEMLQLCRHSQARGAASRWLWHCKMSWTHGPQVLIRDALLQAAS